jgi:hypothetical protein
MDIVDRQIVYPGGIPLDTDLLSTERNIMVAIGYLAQATLGTNMVADGLACVPTSPESMSVVVGAGSITQFGVVDAEAFGSLPAEASPLLRMGVSLTPQSFTTTAPTVPGQGINYLIEATLLETDASPVVLPYYNASNPSQPYSGPANAGTPQNTQRLQQVQLQMKAGPPGPSGQQETPSSDAGWAGLYVVSVYYGQTSVDAGNIVALPAAPFLPWKLPNLSPGTRNLAVFTPADQSDWTVPAGVQAVRLRIWGGGGSGGAGFGGAGGGAAGGGYCEGFFAVAPGQSFFVTVGNGGAGAGTSGGSSSFGSLASATGGAAGANGSAGGGGAGGAAGGSGYGGALSLTGGAGAGAFLAGDTWVSGGGGAGFSGAGAPGATGAVSGASVATVNGIGGTTPGGGGSGGVGGGLGGQGGAGLVLVEW